MLGMAHKSRISACVSIRTCVPIRLSRDYDFRVAVRVSRRQRSRCTRLPGAFTTVVASTRSICRKVSPQRSSPCRDVIAARASRKKHRRTHPLHPPSSRVLRVHESECERNVCCATSSLRLHAEFNVALSPALAGFRARGCAALRDPRQPPGGAVEASWVPNKHTRTKVSRNLDRERNTCQDLKPQ